MKRFSSIFLALIMLMTTFFCFTENVFAYQSWKCGENVTAEFDGGILTISGTGEMNNYTPKEPPEWKNNTIEVKSVVINKGVTSIGNYAFANLFSLTDVMIPDSVTKIGDGAFAACIVLESVDIPDSVTSIGNAAFRTASSTLSSKLESINVGKANKNYTSVDGVLYNKAKTVLIQIPSATAITKLDIADTVETIQEYAGVRCNNIKEITIPSSIRTIGVNAFEHCRSLTHVNINTDRTFIIGVNVFKDDKITIYSYSYDDCYAKRYAQLNNIPFDNFPEITVLRAIDGEFLPEKKVVEVPFGTKPENIPIKLPKSSPVNDSQHIAYNWSSELRVVTEDISYTANGTYENHALSYNIVREATCSQEGIKTPYCNVCGLVLDEIYTPKTNDHTYETVTSVTKATQKSDGSIVITEKCKDCGTVKSSKTTVIPKVSTIALQKTTIGYNWYYTGKQITPYITVKDSTGMALKRGTDYSLTYDSGRVNVGKYSIKVTLKGNYSGTKALTFEIVEKAVNKWIKSGNRWWYRHADGSYTRNGWEKISGKWYHFDKSGWMQTGWLKDGGKWYYLNSSGAMATGWVKVSGKWYYMNSSGAMQTGWIKLSNKWYYLNSSGAMLTGRQKIGNKWYTFNSSGVWIK